VSGKFVVTVLQIPAAAGGSFSQTLAATLDGVTVAASQTASHPQSLAVTLDGVAVAVSQSKVSQYAQALTATLEGVAIAVSQAVSHPQSMTATLGDVAVDVTQTAQHPQALAAALDGVEIVVLQEGPVTQMYEQTLEMVLDGVVVDVAQDQQAQGAIPENPNWTRYVAQGRKRRTNKPHRADRQEQEFNEIPKQVEARPLPVKTTAHVQESFTKLAILQAQRATPQRGENKRYDEEEDIELLLSVL
jgi:hypothetical protein